MTNPYLTSITPDSLSGLVFGFEGIKNTVVLMNGPTGCKFYHSATSDNQALRQEEFDPLNYPELWYFGQPRIPCTYLDKRDYVYGSKDKLIEAITFLKKNLSFDLLVILNSPGAALIGDDIASIAKEQITHIPVITVETPGYSKNIWDGYDEACCHLIKNLSSQTGREHTKKKKVNILGLSIFHKYYQGDKAELKHLLELCNIEVNCFLCCDCSLEEIQHLGDADLNIVLHPAYGEKAAELLKERFGTPYFVTNGLPVGYSAMEEFIHSICTILKTDNQRFIEESEKARARSYIYLSRVNSLTGLPKGVKFAVHGTSAECLGYTRFLIRYFGMYADSISVLDDKSSKEYENLVSLLYSYGMEKALEKDILSTSATMVFADGNIIAKLKARHLEFSGIEIGLPSLGYIDVIPKTHLGVSGGLLITEEIINGLMF